MSKVRSERKHKAKPQARRRRLDRFVRQDADFLAEQIDAVATLMWALAERMEYFGGFNGELVRHAREMAGASVIARKWAEAIRKPNPSRQPRRECGVGLHGVVGHPNDLSEKEKERTK